MIKNKGFNQTRTFGVEVEFFLGGSFMDRDTAVNKVLRSVRDKGVDIQWEGYTKRNTRHWKLVYDASVNHEGLELVSPVLAGDEGLAELETVLEAINSVGAKVDRSCGIHVHHDAGDFELRTFKNLYGLYSRYEPTIDKMMSPSRRGSVNTYCSSVARPMTDLRSISSVGELINYYSSRYLKLNCQSYRRIGTIEFRQHQGTTNFKKLSSWIIVSQMLVERAVNGTVQLKDGAHDFPNFKKVVRGYAWMGADDKQVEAINYMGDRMAELA